MLDRSGESSDALPLSRGDRTSSAITTAVDVWCGGLFSRLQKVQFNLWHHFQRLERLEIALCVLCIMACVAAPICLATGFRYWVEWRYGRDAVVVFDSGGVVVSTLLGMLAGFLAYCFRIYLLRPFVQIALFQGFLAYRIKKEEDQGITNKMRLREGLVVGILIVIFLLAAVKLTDQYTAFTSTDIVVNPVDSLGSVNSFSYAEVEKLYVHRPQHPRTGQHTTPHIALVLSGARAWFCTDDMGQEKFELLVKLLIRHTCLTPIDGWPPQGQGNSKLHRI